MILVGFGTTIGKGAKGRGDLKILKLTLDICALQMKCKQKSKKTNGLRCVSANFFKKFCCRGQEQF